MKKLVFSLLTVFALVLTTSCSSDDDSNGGGENQNQLVMTVNGSQKTFDTVVISNQNGLTTVSASIGSSTNEVLYLNLNEGDTGANVVWDFSYTLNGRSYNAFNSDGSFEPFVSTVVTTNSGSNFTANFSALLGNYNNDTEMYDTISIENGTINVDY